MSPLTWGRLAAFVGRLTQGMFSPEELLLSIFVDDPCMVISGPALTATKSSGS